MKLRLDSFLLFLGAALLPVYPFGSGGIQPAHALLAIFSVIVISRYGIPSVSWSIALISMFFLSFIVEVIYIISGGQSRFIINGIFFFYNFLIVCGIYQYTIRFGINAVLYGIFVAMGIALSTILANGVDLRAISDTGRETGTFNNPNQLGYFSVCLLSFGYLFYRNMNIGYWLSAGIFSVSLFLAISSLSKAAIIANLFVILLALKPQTSRKAIMGWIVGGVISIGVFIHLFQNGRFDDFIFVQRLLSLSQENDSSFEARGYFAFLEGNLLQLIFGLGTQNVNEIVGHEVHSTLGSALNNYGLIGFIILFLLFCIWGFGLLKSYGTVGVISIAGPAMLYGITHNGLRFTIFWMLFATSIGIGRNLLSGGKEVLYEHTG